MRNDLWLMNRLEYIWNNHFSDVRKNNFVIIRFGQHARTRLGSIRQSRSAKDSLDPRPQALNPSIITITRYFTDEIVPEYVIDLVIAHELCHYAHGFCSPHPQLYKNPHQGKVIDKELYGRGFGENIKMQKVWLKEEWPGIIGPHKRRRTIRKRKKLSAQSIIKFIITG